VVAAVENCVCVLQVVNTHLKSLSMGTPMHVAHMGVIGEMLKEAGWVVGRIVGGDMNTILPSDATLMSRTGYWTLGSTGRTWARVTMWGYQPTNRFPLGTSRLDKILYMESDAFDIKDVRRVVVGLKMPDAGWR
jgi:hypothetical protein